MELFRRATAPVTYRRVGPASARAVHDVGALYVSSPPEIVATFKVGLYIFARHLDFSDREHATPYYSKTRHFNHVYIPAIRKYASLVMALIFFPYTIIGTVVRQIPNERQPTLMNMFRNPMPSIQGVSAKTMTVAMALRMNVTPTRASPMSYTTD